MRVGLLVLFAAVLAFAAPASAATGPCRPGGWSPTCTFWTGKVVFVADGEWAQFHNPTSRAVSLHRWWFRDSGLRRYTFPAGAAIPPHGTITLRMGRGTNTRDTFHWGLTTPPLDNVTRDDRAMGDGGYLFDPRGNLRDWVIYH
jgi:hypothetical protein